MKALSIRQPWAHAILHIGKDIENRTWKTSFRGTVAVHVGLKTAHPDYEQYTRLMKRLITIPDNLVTGAVIGCVDIVDCVEEHSSRWFEGPYGFVLANPRHIEPIACKGKLQFFDLPDDVLRALTVRLAAVR